MIQESVEEEDIASLEDDSLSDLENPDTKTTSNSNRELSEVKSLLTDTVSTYTYVKKIIAADDQLINIEVLKNIFTELNLKEKTEFYING